MSDRIFRETKQREAIKQAILVASRPVSPKEILELACIRVPNLGIATVYRNIKTMVERGELETVEIPGQASRYQPPADKKPHLLVDESADRVYSVEIDLAGFTPVIPGFNVTGFQIICTGSAA